MQEAKKLVIETQRNQPNITCICRSCSACCCSCLSYACWRANSWVGRMSSISLFIVWPAAVFPAAVSEYLAVSGYLAVSAFLAASAFPVAFASLASAAVSDAPGALAASAAPVAGLAPADAGCPKRIQISNSFRKPGHLLHLQLLLSLLLLLPKKNLSGLLNLDRKLLRRHFPRHCVHAVCCPRPHLQMSGEFEVDCHRHSPC